MPRPKSDKTTRDRSRRPAAIAPVFVRRNDLARITSLTEGHLRQLADRGDGPPFARIGKVVLYELEPALAWFRRNTTTAA